MTYHPETAQKMFIINAPWVFQGFWKLAQRFVDPVTKSKVSFAPSASRLSE